MVFKLNRTGSVLDRSERNNFNDNWGKIEKVINNRGIEILSDSAFSNWLDKNNFKPKDAVDTFNELPKNPEVNELRGVIDENAIYLYNGSKWVHQSNINFDGITDFRAELSNQTEDVFSVKNRQSLGEDKLQVINYLGNIQNVHPKVLYFKDGWNSWKYWMAYTPYPGGNTNHENPCIAVSMDGINWGDPEGLINPLFDVPDGGYNSDTHLVMKGSTMEIWWRSYLTTEKKAIIYRRTSTNGVSWTQAEIMFDSNDYKDILSPSIIYEDGKYKMWGCLPSQNGVIYNESADGKNWSTTTEKMLDIDLGNLRTWHIDVMKSSKGYEFVVQCYISALGQGNNESDIYYIASADNINFSKPIKIISKSETRGHFADRGLYRATIVDVEGDYVVYYSGISNNNYRSLTFSQGKDITRLKGYSNTGTNDLRAYSIEDTEGISLPRVNLLPSGHGDYGTYLKAHPELRNVAKIFGTLRPELSGGLELGYLYLNDAVDISSQTLPAVDGAIRREKKVLLMHTDGSWKKLNDDRGTEFITAPATIDDMDISNFKTFVFRGTGLITINSVVGGVYFEETTLLIDSSNVTVDILDNGRTVTPSRTKLTLDQTNVAKKIMRMASDRWRVF